MRLGRRSPKLVYPLAGVALAAGAPAGWLLARAWSGGLAYPAAIASEISANPGWYAYLTFATSAAFAVFGYLLGLQAELLRRAASVDHLTGLATRQRLYEFLDQEVAEAVRYRRPLALVMADVDYFKRVNDRHGHRAGDDVLRAVGRVLAESKRRPDIAARFGGEEFLLVLPETTVEEAVEFAERVRQRVASTRVDCAGTGVGVTASFGVAGGIPGDATWRDRLVEAADEALYDAKRSGRNTVAVRGIR
jgi:diguanylate cyclase (GGDEF)-like protein